MSWSIICCVCGADSRESKIERVHQEVQPWDKKAKFLKCDSCGSYITHKEYGNTEITNMEMDFSNGTEVQG